MKLNIACVGDKTSTGGVIIEGATTVFIDGVNVALIGNNATCPCCKKGIGVIRKTSIHKINVDNQTAALANDVIECGCPLGAHKILPVPGRFEFIGDKSGLVTMPIAAGQAVSLGDSDVGGMVKNSFGGGATPPKMNPKNMYWPPYNPSAPEGEKQIEIEYTQDVLEIAMLTPEEWKEFFTNLSHVITGKSTVGGILNAVDTAKALGGLGVVAYVKTYNGVDYLILKNYKKHLKTLLAGNRFKASNPQVVNMGLGALNSVKGMVSYVKVAAPVELLVGSAVNGAQFLLNDEYTLRDLGVDQARLLVNAIATAGVALVVGAFLPAIAATVVGSGSILVLSGFAVYYVDQLTEYSTDFVNFIAEQFE